MGQCIPANTFTNFRTGVEHRCNQHDTTGDASLRGTEQEAEDNYGRRLGLKLGCGILMLTQPSEVLADCVETNENGPQEEIGCQIFCHRETLQSPRVDVLEHDVTCRLC